jgi:hypothetical protein
MKDSVYNAILLYLILVIGAIFVRHPIFFNNGYDLKRNNIIDMPNFIIFVIIVAFFSIYIAKKYD